MVSVVKKLLPGAAGTAGAGGGDDDFNLVTSLFHFNGSNAAQNSTFLDSSDNNLTVQVGSNVPIQGTFSPFSADEGKWGVLFDGSNDYLILPGHSDFTFGSGNWTIEAFVNVDAIDTNYKCIFSASYGVQFYVYNNQLHLAINDTDNTGGYMISANSTAGQITKAGVWYHVAAYRDGNNFYCSVNGTVSSMGSSSATIATPSALVPTVGIFGSGSLPLGGYISNLRVVKGTAIYGSSNFTAPSSPLTAVTNTKLLTCCSNTFKDKSTSAHAISINSNPQVQPFSPFKNTAAYDPAVHGGSFLFEQNTNSYLYVSHATLFDFGTADHCIEAWLYPTQTSFNTSWAMWASTPGANQYWAYTDGGGNASVAGFSDYNPTTGGSYSASNSHILKPFSWNHCVFQNTGGVQNWYLNGTRIYEATNNPNYNSGATGFQLGRSPHYASNYFYGGYISDVRVTTGANYNPYSNAATLTVPTAPLTKGSYTRLLLNGTNAGIIDSAGKGNIEVYGNTQLNTTVKKFGTASAKFDETGDYLVLGPNGYSEHFTLGAGAFTIEGWVYFNSSPTDGQGLFQFDNNVLNNSNGRGPALGTYSGTGKWHRYWGQVGDSARYDGVGDAAATPAAQTWIHFAWVKDESDVLKVFIDGTQIGNSVTYSSDYVDNTTLTIGGYYSSSYLLNGYIDDFRITLKARYTSNFTVPDAQHPSI